LFYYTNYKGWITFLAQMKNLEVQIFKFGTLNVNFILTNSGKC